MKYTGFSVDVISELPANQTKNGGRDLPLPPLHLYRVNQIAIYDFHSPITDVVHSANPSRWIGGFQCLRNTFMLRHLFYYPRKHIFCLFVNIGKVTVQLVACEQSSISCSFMLFQITFVPLSPYADGLCFLFGQF